jgi:nucleoside-diphosphate-sugar epimerase
MRIGITGQDGFIGGTVSRAIKEAGYTVVPLDFITRSPGLAQSDDDAIEYPSNLAWVLHFGAKTSIPDSLDHPFATYAGNIGSTLLALKAAQHAQAAFLFMSSYVYGQPKYLPIDEKHPVASVNPYMGSKIIGEDLCRQICRMAGLQCVILRGFNIFGDQNIPGRLISDLLDAVRREIPLILNNPVPLRDYLYIKDFITLIRQIVVQRPIKTGTYNVGYGQSYSNLEVAELVNKLAGERYPLIIQSHPRPHDILDCSVNTDLVRRTFSWEPAYSLPRALSELIAHIGKEKTGASNE